MNTNRIAIESCWNASFARNMATNGVVVYWHVNLMVLTKTGRYLKMTKYLTGDTREQLIADVRAMVAAVNAKGSVNPRLWTANGRDVGPTTTAAEAYEEAMA